MPAFAPLIRAENLTVAAALIAVYAVLDLGWGLFAVLILAPDIAIAGYLAGPRIGARIYNAAHSYIAPALTIAVAALLSAPMALTVGVIWAAHIAIDRALGFGLKGATFKETHLGPL